MTWKQKPWPQHHPPPKSGKDLWMTFLLSSQKADKDAFLKHINSLDANIHFTYEDPKENGSIPFLDMLIIPDEAGQIKHQGLQKANSHRPIPALG